MARVTLDNFLPIHMRAARALLNMTVGQFADYAGEKISNHKVHSFENARPTHHKTRTALLEAIERAGIQLQNDAKPGARVSDEDAFLKAVQTAFPDADLESLRLR